MELRTKVAMLVEGYQWDSGQCEDEARNIATAILAIPEIKGPVEFAKAVMSSGVGGPVSAQYRNDRDWSVERPLSEADFAKADKPSAQ